MPSAKVRGRVRRLAAGLLISLVAAEITFRVVGTAYLWSRRSARPAEERFGILCVGDSFTFGAAVKEHESYPAVLQELLNSSAEEPRFHVANEGVSAQNSSGLVRRLPYAMHRHRPRIVVAMTGRNDGNTLDSHYFLFDDSAGTGRMRLLYYLEHLKTFKFIRAIFQQMSYRAARPPASSNPPSMPEPDVRLSNQLERTNDDSSKALRLVDNYLKDHPDSAYALQQRVHLLTELRRIKEALGAAEELVRRHPRFAWARLRLGGLYWQFERHGEAIREWEEVLKLDPGNEEARARLYFKWHIRTPMEKAGPVLRKLIRHNLELAAKLARERGARLVIMSYPYEESDHNEILRSVAKETGALYVDNTRAFAERLVDVPPTELFSGDGPEILASHCNANGYRLIAENLQNHLRQAGWLPSEPR